VTEQMPNADEENLLRLVPEDGTIGNTNLRRQLDWDEDHYFTVRNALVDKNILQIGRGRGGSVYRVTPLAEGAAEPDRAQPRRANERELYPDLRNALEQGWYQSLRHRNYIVQTTAAQGRRVTGGRWTRPDITVVAVSTYAYVPGRFMDVITYEVKPEDQWGVEGVFEAASHSRFATYSHLLIHAPGGRQAIREEDIGRLEAECARFRIGLILAKDPRSYDSFEFLVDADRLQPDPEEMNKFIDTQISAEHKRQIQSWI
jgi:hypothetical protein